VRVLREKGLVVSGFLFSTNKDYNDAKEEQEAIDYLREKSDLSNARTALKVYNKLTENRTFHTPVGYSFLKELQDIIIKSGIVKPEDLDGIYIPGRSNANNEVNMLQAEQYKVLAEKEHNRNRNSRIINIFLVGIILVMMVLAIYTDKTVFSNFENSIIDKYAGWEEELSQREQALKESEEKLNGDTINAE
jgi:predicted nucleic acid-binding Zn ribbon protein